MGSVEVFLLRLPVGEEVIPQTPHIYRLAGFTRALQHPVVKDLTWRRHVGPNWGQTKVQQNIFRDLLGVLASTQCGLKGLDLAFNEPSRPGEV